MVISHFYDKIGKQHNEVENVIKAYLDANMVTYKNKSGFIMPRLKGWTLYIQSEKDAKLWEEEPEDIRNFEISIWRKNCQVRCALVEHHRFHRYVQ